LKIRSSIRGAIVEVAKRVQDALREPEPETVSPLRKSEPVRKPLVKIHPSWLDPTLERMSVPIDTAKALERIGIPAPRIVIKEAVRRKVFADSVVGYEDVGFDPHGHVFAGGQPIAEPTAAEEQLVDVEIEPAVEDFQAPLLLAVLLGHVRWHSFSTRSGRPGWEQNEAPSLHMDVFCWVVENMAVEDLQVSYGLAPLSYVESIRKAYENATGDIPSAGDYFNEP
jgi:hypothetical protein